MEPLSPNDPLWKLLGQAKPVKPRPNFTQNVLRAARQAPQEKGFLVSLRARLGSPMQIVLRGSLAATAVIALTLLVRAPAPQSLSTPAGLAQVEKPPLSEISLAEIEVSPPEVSTQWENMEKFDALLAVEDTSELTDREIHLLLY